MKIEESVKRIAWRFSNGWKPNQNDVDALNDIIEFVNKKQKDQFNKNQLFAKMYVHIYGEYLKFYKSTVFDMVPQKELHRILDTPLTEIIEQFRKNLNESELYEIQSQLGFSAKHPAIKTEAEKETDKKIISEIIEDGSVKDTFFNEIWDYATIEKNLKIQINAALNSFE